MITTAMADRSMPLLWVASLVVFFTAATNGLNVEEIERKVDAFAEKLLTCRQIVGLSLAVVSGDTTLMAKGYGVINRDTGEPVITSTLSGIASLTKAFTATVLTKLLSDHSR